MAVRVRIQGGSSSPFRVSASDVDADDTFALIFDGNQSPLRILTHGVVAATRSPGNLAPAVFIQSAVGYTAPPGLFPLFAVSAYLGPTTAVGAPSGNRAQPPWITSSGGVPPAVSGFGGALANGWFYGINYDRNVGNAATSYSVNFLIFRNMG